MKISKAPRPEADDRTAQRRRERVELMRWLLDFLRRDLGTLPAADWARLQRTLDHLAFTLAGSDKVFPITWLQQHESKGRGKQRSVTRGTWLHVSRGEHLTYQDERRNESKFRARLPTQTHHHMRQVQARLRHVLEVLRPSDPPFEPSRVRIMYASIPGAITGLYLMNDVSNEGLGIQRVYGADWRHVRWLAIASLLEEFGARIVRCKAPECTQLFLRTRRQEYCSKKCSQKVRSLKWYTAHRDTAQARRRQAYRDKGGQKRSGRARP